MQKMKGKTMTAKVKVIKESFYKGVFREAGSIIDYEGKNIPSWAQPVEQGMPKLKGVQVQKNNPAKKQQKENSKDDTPGQKDENTADKNIKDESEKQAEFEALKDKAISLGIAYDDSNIPLDEAINTLKDLITQKENQK